MTATLLCPLRFALLATAAGLLGACGGPAEAPSAAPQAQSAEEAGYVAPPSLSSAVRAGAGLRLSGRAPPGWNVRLAAPSGESYTAAATSSGDWSLDLPAPAAPAMFAFLAEDGERIVRGEGAVLLTPAPGPVALLLRPGFGALSLGTGSERPVILAVDYDAGGGAAVAGLARPNEAVRLSLDGELAGQGQTDGQGRFAVMALNRPLAEGVRTIQVETLDGRARAEVDVVVSQPDPLGASAYRAVRQDAGWRIDWAPPGGGVQTSLVFEPVGAEP